MSASVPPKHDPLKQTPIKIAIAGLGVVGARTAKSLVEAQDLLTKRAGRRLQLVGVSARDKGRDRGFSMAGIGWYDSPLDMVKQSDADIVVELIGGADGIALDICTAALSAGKHVVTANKAMMAHHGKALARLAEQNNVQLYFEAAVAGGIPIVKALREGLAGNQIHHLHGILNGTSNYILSLMGDEGVSFEDALKDAQQKGYAEADPSFDINGTDAAHKLALLSAIAFGHHPQMDGLSINGIEGINGIDSNYAAELGFEIKLLGVAEKMADGQIYQSVAPVMVDKHAPIAAVHGVFNGVVCKGDLVGDSLYEGRGAGDGPTSSAVLADIIDIAIGRHCPVFGITTDLLETPKICSQHTQRLCRYYMRLSVVDEPGVIAAIAAILRDQHISIESILQRGRNPGALVDVVLLTHEAPAAAIDKAMAAMDKAKVLKQSAALYPVEAC